MVVQAELSKLGLHYSTVDLGEAEIIENISTEQRERLTAELLKSGLELIVDKRRALIQTIKGIIIELVHYSEEPLPVNFSVFLTQTLNHNYPYLAKLFSEFQGVSIEKFFIEHKIERVKELLICDELSISEIAFKMNYSSVAHLCAQFKKVTGLTSSDFKRLMNRKLYMLERPGIVTRKTIAYF